MICTGIYMNGAGIGMTLIRVVLQMIRSERLLAPAGWYAADTGTLTARTCVLRFGATAIRTAGSTTLASGWCVQARKAMKNV